MKKLYLETRLYICLCAIAVLVPLQFVLAFLAPVLLFIPAMGFALTAAFWWLAIYVPYRRSKKQFALFASGYSLASITDSHEPFNREIELLRQKVVQLLDTDKMMVLSKRQAQFMALQNQINPHFLYNTLESIRSEALVAGLEGVASMAEALSTFFRYTISQMESLVTLKMELDNTKNYFLIQQYRFGRRLHLDISIDEDDLPAVLSYRIPKLALQPVVENAIIHGLENKTDEGHLSIKVATTDRRLLITISDDGIGMDGQTLAALQDKLTFRSLTSIAQPEGGRHGGIALENVNNRIKLLFGEEYGLSVHSWPGAGTDVQLSLPKMASTEAVRFEDRSSAY